MLNHRALAAAVLATGAGAVLFLSTGQDPVAPVMTGAGPVPIVIPPAVTEIPSADPVAPAAERVAPSAQPVAPSGAPVTPSPGKPAVRTTPPVANSQGVPRSVPRSVPRALTPRATTAPATQQQPQPAGTEPNGTGGWQLPACYQDSCVAPSAAPVSTHAASKPAPNPLEQLLAPVLGLIGGL